MASKAPRDSHSLNAGLSIKKGPIKSSKKMENVVCSALKQSTKRLFILDKY